MMEKIDDALIERMVVYFRNAAKRYQGLDTGPGSDVEQIRAIASALPKPVDPDKQAVRDILSSIGGLTIPYSDDSILWKDVGCFANIALHCIKRGREMQKEGK
jgi:hypothetical protein